MTEKFICPYCERLLTEKHYCVSCKKDFSIEAAHTNEGTLPDYQIAQQDYIDNVCFHLLKEFIPTSNWDIRHGKKEYDLYPWLLEPEDTISM